MQHAPFGISSDLRLAGSSSDSVRIVEDLRVPPPPRPESGFEESEEGLLPIRMPRRRQTPFDESSVDGEHLPLQPVERTPLPPSEALAILEQLLGPA